MGFCCLWSESIYINSHSLPQVIHILHRLFIVCEYNVCIAHTRPRIRRLLLILKHYSPLNVVDIVSRLRSLKSLDCFLLPFECFAVDRGLILTRWLLSRKPLRLCTKHEEDLATPLALHR